MKITKKQAEIINRYNRSTSYGLRDVYERYSTAKAVAEEDILREMRNRNGYGYKILGAHSCTFSCAYLYDVDNTTFIVYHTAQNCAEFVYEVKNV